MTHLREPLVILPCGRERVDHGSFLSLSHGRNRSETRLMSIKLMGIKFARIILTHRYLDVEVFYISVLHARASGNLQQ